MSVDKKPDFRGTSKTEVLQLPSAIHVNLGQVVHKVNEKCTEVNNFQCQLTFLQR